MTTTEHPTGQLTRRQLRELRLTGQTPVITQEQLDEAAARTAAASLEPTPAPAPLPRAVETIVPPAPEPSAHADDPDHQPRTRREARELDRVRTASVAVPVVSPAQTPSAAPAAYTPRPAPAPYTPQVAEPVHAEVIETPAATRQAAPQAPAPSARAQAPSYAPNPGPSRAQQGTTPRVAADFGEAILSDPETAVKRSTPSFESLLTRDAATSGSSAGASALILPDSALAPLTAPVASSGQTLITGTFSLPESLSSQGHAGAADGRDADAVLIDGELAPASSPTPIAATAAVSQAKAPGEIIKPPAPEKGNKLMLALAITAGALALTLGAVIVVALLNGALQ